MKAVRVASLLRRGMYKEAEKEAHRKHISYFDFCELVKRFYHGTLTEEDIWKAVWIWNGSRYYGKTNMHYYKAKVIHNMRL